METDLFNSGVRPAINPGLSVSRVGGSAQIEAMKRLAGPLRIEFAQYKELAAFSQFGSDLNVDTIDRLDHGARIMEVLKQPQYRPLPVEDQVLIIYALSNNHMADIELNDIGKFQRELIKYIEEHAPHVRKKIRDSGKIAEKEADEIDALIHKVKLEYEYIEGD